MENKKRISMILVFMIILTMFSACGKSEAVKATETMIDAIGTVTLESDAAIVAAEDAYAVLSVEDKAKVGNYSDLEAARTEYDLLVEESILTTLLGEWKNVGDGDSYVLQENGIGQHDGVDITYTIDATTGTINIVEGVTSVEEKVFQLNTTGTYVQLVPEGENTYYVLSADYAAVSELVQKETLATLTACEFWSSTQAINYISFHENGTGFFLLTGYTSGLSWEYLDNNTVKVSITTESGGYSKTLDVVNDNGTLQLLDHSDGSVAYLPKQ